MRRAGICISIGNMLKSMLARKEREGVYYVRMFQRILGRHALCNGLAWPKKSMIRGTKDMIGANRN